MSRDLKYKMYDYEVAPPKEVWNAIADDLEQRRPLTSLAEKMYSYEVAPPAASWKAIKAELDGTAGVRPAPVLRTISRWAAAAAITGLLLTASYYILTTSKEAVNISDKQSAANTPEESKQLPQSNLDNKATTTQEALASSSQYTREKQYIREEDNKILHWSYVEDALPVTNEQYISVTPKPILSATGELIQDNKVVNPGNKQYISITAPNGEQTKISSKLINALQYLGNNDDYSDDDVKENMWQKRIREWRSKIIKSGFVPSSGNFLDILEFTELINEN